MDMTQHDLPGKIVLALVLCAASVMPSRAIAAPAQAAAASDSDQRNRMFQQAQAFYLSGHLQEAATAFEELTRAYPRDARIWLKYGNTLTKQGSYDAAATAFQTAAGLDPAQGAAHLNLSLVRLAQAQAALDSALASLAPNSAEHAQAEALQRQIKVLLGAPDGATTH